MPEDVKKVRVFVASPNDMQSEKAQLSAVVQEINITHGQYKGFILDLVEWKTHSYPAMGRPQGVINQQIGSYDIFIGIMWKRFGSPTGEAESGTEEEFRAAYKIWEYTGAPHISFYFCQAPSAPPKTSGEIEQLSKVLRFHNEVSEKGLVYEYQEHAGFADAVRPHLIHILNKMFPNLSIQDENAIKALVQDVFEKNFIRLQAVAQEEAQRRVDLLKKRISETVSSKLSNDELSKFGEPDVQYALFEAIKAGARSDNQTLRNILTSLIVERVRKNDDDLKRIIYNEAIATLGKLTSNQLDILALRLIVDWKVYSLKEVVGDWRSYLKDLDYYVKPFVNCRITDADIKHLQYSACAYVLHFDDSIIRKFESYVPFIFQNPIDEEQVFSLKLPEYDVSDIFVPIQLEPGEDSRKYAFKRKFYNDLDEEYSEDHLRGFHFDISAEQIMKIRELLHGIQVPESEINQRLPEAVRVLNEKWKGSARGLSLTSVGTVLATCHIEQTLGEALDISDLFT